MDSTEFIALDEQWSTHNYHPLPVVLTEGEGVWVRDVRGQRYLDFLAGYSALNFGHRHPQLIAAATAQLHQLTLTSRAFHHDQLGLFCRELAELTGTEMVLPMNSGAEAVESAVKVARKWAYHTKGIPEHTAEIVVAGANFHGRTTTIISFSTEPLARNGFGPYTPGFRVVHYGDSQALTSAINHHTAAVLLEPIQGEAGVIVPPQGYLRDVRRICDERQVLFIADEIQSGLGRAGDLFACDHEDVRADLYTVGKALGGGIMPVSAVVGRKDVLGVLQPGEHGSTFGGNPLACAIGRAVIQLLSTGEYQKRSRVLGAHLHRRLSELVGHGVHQIRGRGLWAGIELQPGRMTGSQACLALLEQGVLAKEAHETTIRIMPPLVISHAELDQGIDAISTVLSDR